ncbi:MAG: cytochrome c biogenesis CcdA family protein [Actinomycetota bacterium]
MNDLAVLAAIRDVTPPAYVAAFGGGVVSFLSPCVLPLVPGYLSIVTGLDLSELESGARENMRRVVRTTALFVAGFGTVFVILGVGFSGVGQLFKDHQALLTRLSGAFMLAMALFLLGSLFLRAPWFYQEKRFHPQLGRFGAAAPAVAGAAFGFGWTPCIGPILGSILTMAANERTWAAATLLVAYTLGLGLPFLVVGLALGRLAGALGWMRRHFTALVAGSAIVLGWLGVLLILDDLPTLTRDIQDAVDGTPLEWLVELG